MKNFRLGSLALFFSFCILFTAESKNKTSNKSAKSKTTVQFWLTSPSNNILFQQQNALLTFGEINQTYTVIKVDANQTKPAKPLTDLGIVSLTAVRSFSIKRVQQPVLLC